jgi:hypothetical protein
MKFLGHCRYPKWTEDWIIPELGVLCDGLFGHEVDDTIAHFLNVYTVEHAIGRLGEDLRDCIGRGGVKCKVDDIVEGLA